ncbi:MAG: hypothetical protein ACJ8DZ_10420, partial [Allosphingosinicella sp.]
MDYLVLVRRGGRIRFVPAPRWRCGAAMPRCSATGTTAACGAAHAETQKAGLQRSPALAVRQGLGSP